MEDPLVDYSNRICLSYCNCSNGNNNKNDEIDMLFQSIFGDGSSTLANSDNGDNSSGIIRHSTKQGVKSLPKLVIIKKGNKYLGRLSENHNVKKGKEFGGMKAEVDTYDEMAVSWYFSFLEVGAETKACADVSIKETTQYTIAASKQAVEILNTVVVKAKVVADNAKVVGIASSSSSVSALSNAFSKSKGESNGDLQIEDLKNEIARLREEMKKMTQGTIMQDAPTQLPPPAPATRAQPVPPQQPNTYRSNGGCSISSDSNFRPLPFNANMLKEVSLRKAEEKENHKLPFNAAMLKGVTLKKASEESDGSNKMGSKEKLPLKTPAPKEMSLENALRDALAKKFKQVNTLSPMDSHEQSFNSFCAEDSFSFSPKKKQKGKSLKQQKENSENSSNAINKINFKAEFERQDKMIQIR